MTKIFLVACLSLLVGCTATVQKASSADQQTDSFQLHTAPDGRVYRIDTRNGNTTWLDGASFRRVIEPTMQQLGVGKIYRGEDGISTYRYEGSGRLEKWGLERYNISPQESKPTQR